MYLYFFPSILAPTTWCPRQPLSSLVWMGHSWLVLTKFHMNYVYRLDEYKCNKNNRLFVVHTNKSIFCK